MSLEMKGVCESCHATVCHHDEVYICSYECTFCRTCRDRMQGTSPNCGGELVRRPVRKVDPDE